MGARGEGCEHNAELTFSGGAETAARRAAPSGMAPQISLVIPAYNEARYLPRLLGDVARASRRFAPGPAAIEVIVADNGSTDATATIARFHGCRVVHVRPRCIGAARNAGARAARGEIVAFVDADFRVHPRTFAAITEHLDGARRIVGLTGCHPERASPAIVASWGLLGVLTAMSGYGVPRRFSQCMPSGVVACRRGDWLAVGGYDEERLFGEDVRFVLDLHALGRARGQAAGWIEGAPATCSLRKFDRYGDWHYLALPLRLAWWALFDPRGRARWARDYWYTPRR